MTHTISLVADHKGNTRPKVMGDEYIALGDMTTTSYRTGSPANASVNIDAATDETLTRASGDFVADGFIAGDYVTIVGSDAANDAHLIELLIVTPLVISTTPATAISANSGGGEVITHAGEKILASSFGLSTMTHIEIVSQQSMLQRYVLSKPSDDGTYCYLYAFNTNADNNSTLLGASLVGGADVAGGATELGGLRLKVTGSL